MAASFSTLRHGVWMTLCGERVPTLEACRKFGINNRQLRVRVSRDQGNHTEVFYDLLADKMGIVA